MSPGGASQEAEARALRVAGEAPAASEHRALISPRRARQLAAQEDGASRDASSRASQQVEDEVGFLDAWLLPAGCLLGAAAELTVPSQFLSLDDLPDTRGNVDLRNEQAPGVSALPHRWG